MAQKRVILDFETRSMADLKKQGAFKYSLDPTTQPTCLAFKIVGEPTVYFLDFEMVNRPFKDLPEKFRKLWHEIVREKYLIVAHNVFFDASIYTNILYKRYGWPNIPFRQYRCTAAKAAACALPRSLEGAGEALRLPIQKDKRGYVAVMATCKPTKEWRAWKKIQDQLKSGARITEKTRLKGMAPEPVIFITPKSHPAVFETLYTYCKIDVRTEELVDKTLPDLIPEEQEIWFLNQMLNWRGLRVDIPLVEKIVTIMASESKKKLDELDALTMGLVTKPGARQAILDFLAIEGIKLDDIRAKTVDDNLKGDALSEDARRLLELRKALSLTSTKKYQAFLNRANDDHRVRDIQLYHGASTGRDSGTGVQIQNLPRPLLKQKEIESVIAMLNGADAEDPTIVSWLSAFYGEPAMVFSALLRSMFIPTRGHELFVADFSKIEVAVLWWLAGNEPGLDILRSGRDPYKYMAAKNTGKRYEDIADDGDERQLGKCQILGAGFGMSWAKFQKTAFDMYRLKLSDSQSKIAVENYRTANSAVPALWKNYEAAAVHAVKKPGAIVKMNYCKFFTKDKFLWIELPSGRRLAYREPQISWRETSWGESKETLEFMAANSKTKKWSLERTWGAVLVENCFASNTLILTDKGAKKISSLTRDDLVFDGLDFVKHEGVICQGEKEVGSWLTTQVTPNHLISDGASWCCVMHLTEHTTQKCLGYARDLVNSWLLHPDQAKTPNRTANVTAALKLVCSPGPYSEGKLPVENAGTQLRPRQEQQIKGIGKSSKTLNYALCGCIGIREWFRDAAIKIVPRIKIMAAGGYESIISGLRTDEISLSTQSALRTGIDSDSIWTGSIMRKITSPGISEWYRGRRIHETGGQLVFCLSGVKKLGLWIFGRNIVLTGKVMAPYVGIFKKVEPPNKLWVSTQKKEKVFDIINCGPRHQFMVLTPSGPIIAHNCVQATAREFLMHGMLRLEKAGYRALFSVHDEAICEREIGKGTLAEFVEILCELPEWAKGLPLEAKGWRGERYRK